MEDSFMFGDEKVMGVEHEDVLFVEEDRSDEEAAVRRVKAVGIWMNEEVEVGVM